MGVVMIIMLISTMVSISWQAIVPREQLNSDVRALASALQGARSNAIARNAEFRLIYDLDNERYRTMTPYRVGGGLWTLAEDEADRQVTSWQDLADGVEFARIVVDGEEYTEGEVYVRFDPLGAASDHAVTLIHHPYETMYTIEVLALTGLIRFHEGEFMREAPTSEELE
jgi:Tfp pilus assembly protein FimT